MKKIKKWDRKFVEVKMNVGIKGDFDSFGFKMAQLIMAHADTSKRGSTFCFLLGQNGVVSDANDMGLWNRRLNDKEMRKLKRHYMKSYKCELIDNPEFEQDTSNWNPAKKGDK